MAQYSASVVKVQFVKAPVFAQPKTFGEMKNKQFKKQAQQNCVLFSGTNAFFGWNVALIFMNT